MKALVEKLSTLAVVAVVTTTASSTFANFASDPTRKNSTSFTRFFLKRFDKWFVANVGDPRKGLDKKEVAFVDEYLRTANSFGQSIDGTFVRFVGYGVTVDGDKLTPGPFRFVLSDEQAQLKASILDLAKAKGVVVDKKFESLLKGVGFTGSKDELELVFKDESGSLVPETLKKSVKKKPVWITKLYREGKPVFSEYLELDVDSHAPCLGARSFSQVDRVSAESSDAVSSCHISLFEDRALMPAARSIAVKIRRGFNLVPGTLEVSGKHTRMFYP